MVHPIYIAPSMHCRLILRRKSWPRCHITALAALVADVVGYRGALCFNTDRPDGTPRKLLDVSKLAALGWRARIGLREGLANAYADFLKGGWREA